MAKYLVLTSFYSAKLGSHSDGEELELTDEQVIGHQAFLKPLAVKGGKPAPSVETAMLEPDVETADVKTPRRKKG
jgi:hypothetical protein